MNKNIEVKRGEIWLAEIPVMTKCHQDFYD